MTLNKAQRMVKILEQMARRDGVRASELMTRFELDARSLRRYLADLRSLGIPIRDDGRADDRVVSVDPAWRRTGVQLTLAEVLSLHFGRTLFTFLDGTSFARDLSDAIERLQPAIARTHADLAAQLDTKFLAVSEHAKDFRESSDIIDDLVSAVVYNNPIAARYRRVGGIQRAYHLHPYTLATYRQGLYVFALDVQEHRVKTFAVERFTEVVRRRSERFPDPRGWNPRAHLAHAFGIIAGDPEDVVVVFRAEAATYASERTWHPTQTFRTLPDGRLELRMRVTVSAELVQWILGFGADAVVTGPPSLVRRIQDQLRDALARYGEQPVAPAASRG